MRKWLKAWWQRRRTRLRQACCQHEWVGTWCSMFGAWGDCHCKKCGKLMPGQSNLWEALGLKK